MELPSKKCGISCARIYPGFDIYYQVKQNRIRKQVSKEEVGMMDQQRKELHWFETLPEEGPKSGKQRTKSRNKDESKPQVKAMKNQNLINLEKYTEETERWIDEVAVLIKAGDRKDWAWNALRGVLQTLRDRITPVEVFHLSAQLPMLIRGLFLEGYHISDKPEKFRVGELKDRIEGVLGPAVTIEPEAAFKGVLLVLHDHVSEGELDDIYRSLPKDIRRLWDKSMQTYEV